MAADLEGRVRELEARVQELTDREAVRDLRYRFHECVNEGRFTDIPSLFTEDGELDFAQLGKAKGRAEINKFFGNLNEDPKPQSKGRPDPAPASKPQKPVTFVKQFIHNHT